MHYMEKVGLDKKIPKNRLKTYLDNLAKSSIKLFFFPKNLTCPSENLKKLSVIVD